MSNLQILIHPDKRLRLLANNVTQFDGQLAAIIKEMYDLMYASKGIGLASTQVNIQKRFFIVDVPREDESGEIITNDKFIFINPEIIDHSEEKSIFQEGCLSIPGQYAEVERPASIVCKYQDLDGKYHELEADGLLATCIQHELDHLNGVLFIDYLSRLKRERLEKKLAKSLKYA